MALSRLLNEGIAQLKHTAIAALWMASEPFMLQKHCTANTWLPALKRGF